MSDEGRTLRIEIAPRTLFLIVNIDAGEEMVRIAEPLWLGVEADIDIYPAMSVSDFDKAGPIIGSVVPKY